MAAAGSTASCARGPTRSRPGPPRFSATSSPNESSGCPAAAEPLLKTRARHASHLPRAGPEGAVALDEEEGPRRPQAEGEEEQVSGDVAQQGDRWGGVGHSR